MSQRSYLSLVLLGVLLAGGYREARAQAASVPGSQTSRRALLRDPAHSIWKTRAPDTVRAEMETSRGTMTLELIRSWSPRAVDRFYNLARVGYYDDTRFYRVLWGFVAQFGISADPAVTRLWSRRNIPADAPREKNVRGTLAFAQSKPSDRTTHAFINLSDNAQLDTLKFVPFGRVIAGMEVADSIHALYGEAPTSNNFGGSLRRFSNEGNRYLDEKYPKLDRIVRIVMRP